jgi:DNA polymerase elongation subunit (family B)
MKILILDIETAPTLAHVWGLWGENIPIQRIVKPGYVLCFTAKWAGDKDVTFQSRQYGMTREMLMTIHDMLDQADVVVHYNGKRFDIPTLNREFLLYGMAPPSPYKQIDLLTVVRNQFKFQSNKLDYVIQQLGLGKKQEHPGYEMWVGCMNGDKKAWEQMAKYNIQDVYITEKLYYFLLPWIKNHPNVGVYKGIGEVCPNCGGIHLQKRGFTYTGACKYQRYQCQGCKTWSRSKHAEKQPKVLANA